MSDANMSIVLASVFLPRCESVETLLLQLRHIMPEYCFEEEITGRYEEVPAYLADQYGMEAVLFEIQDSESDEGYVLEFRGSRDISINEFFARQGFIQRIANCRTINNRGFLDFSVELASALHEAGLSGCRPTISTS